MAGDCLIFQEESPDYNEAGFHLTDGYRKIRESATENKPLFDVTLIFMLNLHFKFKI